MTGDLQEVLDLRHWREADFDPPDRALLGFAEKFTLESHRIDARDIQGLRDVGFGDTDIVDMVLCAGYRHYITRIADATGIEVDAELGISDVVAKTYTHSREKSPLPRGPENEGSIRSPAEVLLQGPWIEVPGATDSSLGDVFSAWERDCGFVPGLLRALSLRPMAVEKISSFWRLACLAGSRLGRQREAWLGATIALMIPSPWLLEIYEDTFSRHRGSPSESDDFPDWRSSILPNRDKAVLQFAELMTERASSITRDHVDELRKAGFSDAEIVDVIVATSLLNCLGRMANALGVPPDFAAAGVKHRESQR